MDDFDVLRERARQKKERTIAAALNEYKATMARIAAIEGSLAEKQAAIATRATVTPVYKCVEMLILNDRPFTVPEIMEALFVYDASRGWKRSSVENYIHKMRLRGVIRRLKRTHGKDSPAVYVREGVPAENNPFDLMTIRQAMKAVMDRPMRPVEVVVAMIEGGFKTANPKQLQNAVRVELGGVDFVKDGGGKWRVAIT